VRFLAVFAFLFVSMPALAGFTDATTFESASGTSLKVVGAEGASLSVVIDGTTRTDTIPAIFNTDDKDRFVTLTATGVDGSTWSKKAEIKAYQKTIVTPSTPGSAPAATPATAAHPYVGWVMNTANNCSIDQQYSVRFDFTQDGQTIYSFQLNAGQSLADAQVNAGHYDIRYYVYSGDQWVYQGTNPYDVTADGWKWYWGC